MPVSFLKTLLLVGIDEGQTAAEYGRRAGVDRFQMSRYMRTLGRYNVKQNATASGGSARRIAAKVAKLKRTLGQRVEYLRGFEASD